jgi:hypothetical protein
MLRRHNSVDANGKLMSATAESHIKEMMQEVQQRNDMLY